MRLLRWVGWSALLLALLMAAAALWYRQASQPLHEGKLAVPGLDSPAKVQRDEQGIPTIVAAGERDAAFALGFVHAQDRLWQMEFNRRLAAGRLAEVLGPSALPTDQFLRTLGVHRVAQKIYQSLDAEHRALADAYVGGVNAYLATRSGPLPPEFLLTRAPAPEPWTPADSVAWSLMMAWDLASYSMRMELRRLRLAQNFTRAEIDDFYPPLPGEAPPAAADYVEMYRLLGALKSGSTNHERTCWPRSRRPASAKAKVWARITGCWPVGARSAASRCSRMIRTLVSPRPRSGTSPHCRLQGWTSSARRCPACRASCWGGTRMSPGA